MCAEEAVFLDKTVGCQNKAEKVSVEDTSTQFINFREVMWRFRQAAWEGSMRCDRAELVQ